MRKFSTKQYVIAGVAAAALAAGGGLAYAYWTTSGSGTGTATTSAGTANLTVTPDSTPSGLQPGSAAQALGATVTNNATNLVHIDSVTVGITSVTLGGNPAVGCDSTDFTISNGGLLTNPATTELAGGASRDYTGATIAFNDKSTNQDGCKGVTVNLKYTVNSA
jgi:hypothetical protein